MENKNKNKSGYEDAEQLPFAAVDQNLPSVARSRQEQWTAIPSSLDQKREYNVESSLAYFHMGTHTNSKNLALDNFPAFGGDERERIDDKPPNQRMLAVRESTIRVLNDNCGRCLKDICPGPVLKCASQAQE